MKTKTFIHIFTILFLFVPLSAQNKVQEKSTSYDSLNYQYSRLNINNISTHISYDGRLDNAPDRNAGFIFPKGSSKPVIFISGIAFGTKINNQIITTGNFYSSRLVPGIILPTGTTEEYDGKLHRVYRVRKDYKTSDLKSEIDDGEGTYEEIYQRYEKDWNEWPVDRGASFNDINGNGVYEPEIDIPGYFDADQTCWFVVNGLYYTWMDWWTGVSTAIPIEIQITSWAYSRNRLLTNTIFRSYKFINKSEQVFDSSYISILVDPDIGGAVDDFVGCDTMLNLGYSYNSFQKDEQYGISSPSVGFRLEQGPIVDGRLNEVALIGNRKIQGSKNLGMTSFFFNYPFYLGGTFGFYDFTIFPPINITWEEMEKFYTIMKGKIPCFIQPMILPIMQTYNKYWLPGDPVTGTGWIDGIILSAGDRRFIMNTGPFTMAPGDTQEIIYSINVGHVADIKQSIKLMKYFSMSNYQSYLYEIEPDQEEHDIKQPYEYILYQNYPNPFNPTTKIKFDLPMPNQVSLKIHDILGREIITLVDDFLEAGIYEIEFNAENLSSGIYFYRIDTKLWDKTRSMIFMK